MAGNMFAYEEKKVSDWDFRLGQDLANFEEELDRLSESGLVEQIWKRDYRVWGDSPAEICNRLGWLDIHERMKSEAPALQAWAKQIHDSGLRQAVVIGMGGSSLAPEVFSELVTPIRDSLALKLYILDSTDPVQFAELDSILDLTRTLFIVATKSGGTVETLSGYTYYRDRFQRQCPSENAGEHFVGITDPGSSLIELAQKDGWQRVFVNDPDIGGRYSALSFFGLVPLALLGADVGGLLENVDQGVQQCQMPFTQNYAAKLGAFMAFQALRGRDKLTLLMPPRLYPLGDWLEQLVAESLGKDGKGILPVLRETAEEIAFFGKDRCCVVFWTGQCQDVGEQAWSQVASTCVNAGHPTAVLPSFPDNHLGVVFFQWEFAVAVAGHCLGVHPFDQPDVESAKIAGREFLDVYADSGKLPLGGTVPPCAIHLTDFLKEGKEGNYVSLQAYLPLNNKVKEQLEALRQLICRRSRMATTVGIGPRFLHSTGQMHKGGPNSGLFIQLLKEPSYDMDIPGTQGAQALSFGTLQAAQAMGDAEALKKEGRRILRVQLGREPIAALKGLITELIEEPSVIQGEPTDSPN